MSSWARLARYCLVGPAIIPSLINAIHRRKNRYVENCVLNNYYCPPPKAITIFPTYRCNLRCSQCGQWGDNGVFKSGAVRYPAQELSAEQWNSFIEEAAPFRPYLYFNGGEPLLHQDITRIVKFAYHKNLLTSMVSNCVMLEDKAEALADSGLFVLWGSIDGIEDTNDSIRKGSDFQKIIKGIKKLLQIREKKKGTPFVRILTVILKSNQNELLKMANYFQKELPIDMWALTPGVFTTKELADKNSAIYEDLLGVSEKYWQGYIRETEDIDTGTIKRQLDVIRSSRWRFKVELMPPLDRAEFDLFRHYNHPEQPHGSSSCRRSFMTASIEPNGDVTCCQNSHAYVTGNILQNNFLSIWNGDKFRDFRRIIRSKQFPCCPRCTAFYTYYR